MNICPVEGEVLDIEIVEEGRKQRVLSGMVYVCTCSIAVVVVDWDVGTVDWELFKIGASVAIELGVEVGEETALEEGVFGEVDAADDVAWLELRGVRDRFEYGGGGEVTMTCSVSAK